MSGLMSTQIIIPIFNMMNFVPYLFWINVVLIVSLLLNVYLLIVRKWQSVTRAVTIALDLLGIAIFTQLVFDPDLWSFNLIINKLGATTYTIETIWKLSIYITLAAVVIAVAFDVVKHLKVLLRKNEVII